MDLTDIIGTLIGLLVAVVFLLLIWRTLLRRSRRSTQLPESLSQVSQARIDENERASAVVSEQIEEMVKQKLAGVQDLADVAVDFATAADGSLEIWIGDERYADADHIPDDRIRSAIAEAVDTFNR